MGLSENDILKLSYKMVTKDCLICLTETPKEWSENVFPNIHKLSKSCENLSISMYAPRKSFLTKKNHLKHMYKNSRKSNFVDTIDDAASKPHQRKWDIHLFATKMAQR